MRCLLVAAALGAVSVLASCRGQRQERAEPAGSQTAPALRTIAVPPESNATASRSAPARVPIARTQPETRNDFPCRGCETRVPPTDDIEAPAPLLVVLHGDLGDVSRMTRVWQQAALSHGMVLTSLLCPRDKGCNNSWWRWYLGPRHDPSWIGQQIDAVAERLPIDPARVYAAGYSGGASYLGYYGPSNPDRFAAIAHVAGGVRFVSQCPRRKTPVSFLIGNRDPMLALYVAKLRAWYGECGHAVSWNLLPGVTHDGIVPLLQAGKASEVVEWLLGMNREGTTTRVPARPDNPASQSIPSYSPRSLPSPALPSSSP